MSPETDGTTNFVQVLAQSVTPADAINVANTYASQAVLYQQKQQQQQIQQAIAGLKQGISHRRAQSWAPGALSVALANLEALQAINPVDVAVAQQATSATLVSKKASTKALEGLLLGAIVGSSSRCCSTARPEASGCQR